MPTVRSHLNQNSKHTPKCVVLHIRPSYTSLIFESQCICCNTHSAYSDVFKTRACKGKIQHISYLLSLVPITSMYWAAQLPHTDPGMNINRLVSTDSTSLHWELVNENKLSCKVPVRQELDGSSRPTHTAVFSTVPHSMALPLAVILKQQL